MAVLTLEQPARRSAARRRLGTPGRSLIGALDSATCSMAKRRRRPHSSGDSLPAGVIRRSIPRCSVGSSIEAVDAGGRRRALPDQAHVGEDGDGRGGRLRRRPRHRRRGAAVAGARRGSDGTKSPMDAARQRSLERAVFAVDELGAYEYTVEAGSIASRRGARSCEEGRAPARTCRANCSKERRSCARRRPDARRGATIGCWRTPASARGRGVAELARLTAALSPSCRTHMAAADRSRATRYERVLTRARRARARALRRLVRDVPALGRHRSDAQRDVRRGRGPAALRRVDGLRRPVPAADPSDRPQLPQGTQQRARRRGPAIRAAHGRSAPTKAATRRSSPGSARSTDFDRFVDGSERASASRSRSTSRFRRRRIIPRSREHPEWFRHRPDGTIKYAENPPKKYQDIYPFDFESDDWRGAVAAS